VGLGEKVAGGVGLGEKLADNIGVFLISDSRILRGGGIGMQPQIIGGRDGKEGGTWLAISEAGRVAFVTNFREPEREQPGAVSRGRLPTLFLESSKSPADYLEEVAARAGEYNGFNLVVADTNTGEMAYLSNRPRGQPIEVKQVRYLETLFFFICHCIFQMLFNAIRAKIN
jgi:hypothetical protein